jgi:hypothetical protein
MKVMDEVKVYCPPPPPQVVKAITSKEVYGSEVVHAPKGYEFTGEFHPPQPGETFQHSLCKEAVTFANPMCSGPRFILRKAKQQYRLVFEPIGDLTQQIPVGSYFQLTGASALRYAECNVLSAHFAQLYTLRKEAITP